MSKTLYDCKYVDIEDFRVHRSGKIEQLENGEYIERNKVLMLPPRRTNNTLIPEIRVAFRRECGKWNSRPLHTLMAMALTGKEDVRNIYARPLDGDIRNTNYMNYTIIEGLSDLYEYQTYILNRGYYCQHCHTYNDKGVECKGCRRYKNYLEDLSNIYPNTEFLTVKYKTLLDLYNKHKNDESLMTVLTKKVGGINRIDTMLDNLYDSEDNIWQSATFRDIYRKMTLDDTITVNELVRLNMTVEEFMEFALTLNPDYKYELFVGCIKGKDADILIKESALID